MLSALLNLARAFLVPRAMLVAENAALRQQLAVYVSARKRPKLEPADRVFWVFLRRVWSDWARALVIVKPASVIGWHSSGRHSSGLRALWRRKCGSGRPWIPRNRIEFIKRISADHPQWGEVQHIIERDGPEGPSQVFADYGAEKWSPCRMKAVASTVTQAPAHERTTRAQA